MDTCKSAKLTYAPLRSLMTLLTSLENQGSLEILTSYVFHGTYSLNNKERQYIKQDNLSLASAIFKTLLHILNTKETYEKNRIHEMNGTIDNSNDNNEYLDICRNFD
ncbi:hypothetical protein GQX74_015434 [Glossina fuscipes]|nr:hypothetical protein GQX74_015434 [Glossina fuscipes]